MTREERTAAGELFDRLRSRMTLSADARKRRTKRANESASEPFGGGRDPRGLGAIVTDLTSDLGWTPFLTESDLMSGWPEVVGPDVAARTSPQGLTDGTLLVLCESTAWATQLRMLSPEILTRLVAAFPDARVTALSFRGPDQPSWKRGLRSVPGRGPRDTFG
ncbi:MAG: DciA family protein [Aurantimicrobium sp.]|nr:DciA family protein [Aurantimicrobium sp.]